MQHGLHLLSTALSHLATHVVLEPLGRKQLRQGIQALLRTAPLPLPDLIEALADGPASRPFLFGLRGARSTCSMLLTTYYLLLNPHYSLLTPY